MPAVSAAASGRGYYAAVKAAIEALTLSLRKEVAPLGITAMVVEPGGFRTEVDTWETLSRSTAFDA